MKTDLDYGARLDVELERLAETEPGTLLAAKFLGEDGEGRFLIDAPMRRTMLFPLREGEVCYCSWHDSAANYSLSCEVLKRIIKGEQIFYSMFQTSEVERIQRRDDFRLTCTLEGRLLSLNEKQEPMDEPFVTVDISGGGMSIRTTKKIDESKVCEVRVAFEPEKPLELKADVCWGRSFDDSKWKHSYGLKFVHKDEREKEYISKFVFQKQLEQRRRAR